MLNLKKNTSFINGQWLMSQTNTYPVFNPANAQEVSQVLKCGAEETEQAIVAADHALATWKTTLAAERSQVLRRWGELMLEYRQQLAEILVEEQGKPLAEALGEVAYAASFFEWFAEEAKRNYGDIIPTFKAQTKIMVTKEPVGVVAAITPWNFPLAMVTRKVAPALAAGCTMILKPSEETPLSAFALAVLAEQAGVPAGVFNIVSGNAIEIGKTLQSSEKVKKISFTGSTATGKLLMRQAADTLKKTSFELGGNAPFIVFEDADLEAAVQGAMASKYRNTGQTCVCVNRFYIHEKVYESFIELLSAEVKKLKVGQGFVDGVTQGPLINQAAITKVQRHIDDALAKGGSIVTGGKPHQLGGLFYEPTIIQHANDQMLVAHEETFGPVAACFSFASDEEAIALANNTQYGLSAYFYTKDLKRTWWVAEQLQVGMVGINEGIISTAVAPFGGVKESGFGREGSKYGLEEYQNIKYILLGGLA